jgi:hypothetical protein
LADEVQKLRTLAKLHAAGDLSDAEFAAAKAAVLSESASEPATSAGPTTGRRSMRLRYGILGGTAVLLLAAGAVVVLFLSRGDEPAPSNSIGSPAGGSEQTAADFCTEYTVLDEDMKAYFDETGDTDDPVQSQAVWQRAADRWQTVEPPAEIADDWAVLADWLGQQVAVWDLYMTDKEAAEAEARRLDEDPAYQQATENIGNYLSRECGIE